MHGHLPNFCLLIRTHRKIRTVSTYHNLRKISPKIIFSPHWNFVITWEDLQAITLVWRLTSSAMKWKRWEQREKKLWGCCQVRSIWEWWFKEALWLMLSVLLFLQLSFARPRSHLVSYHCHLRFPRVQAACATSTAVIPGWSSFLKYSSGLLSWYTDIWCGHWGTFSFSALSSRTSSKHYYYVSFLSDLRSHLT